jgi:hypothetical protein
MYLLEVYSMKKMIVTNMCIDRNVNGKFKFDLYFSKSQYMMS